MRSKNASGGGTRELSASRFYGTKWLGRRKRGAVGEPIPLLAKTESWRSMSKFLQRAKGTSCISIEVCDENQRLTYV